MSIFTLPEDDFCPICDQKLIPLKGDYSFKCESKAHERFSSEKLISHFYIFIPNTGIGEVVNIDSNIFHIDYKNKVIYDFFSQHIRMKLDTSISRKANVKRFITFQGMNKVFG